MLTDELSKLAELHANGSLTDAEFTRAKERLLNADSTAGRIPLASVVNPFRRARADRWFGGVCGGMARSTGLESWAWRLIFAVLFICGGVGLLIYLLLWVFVPSD